MALSKDGVSRHFLVSRLVAEAFCPNPDPENATTIDHIDQDKLNNKASNLRWMSQKDNYKAYCERKHKNNDESNSIRENEEQANP